MLQSLNSAVGPGEKPILPHECLAFEDSVVGVTAARRAGMRVVWVPHPDMAAEYQSRQKEVLVTGTGITEVGDDWHPRQIDDGWSETIPSQGHFDYKEYGIVVPSWLFYDSMNRTLLAYSKKQRAHHSVFPYQAAGSHNYFASLRISRR